MALYHGSWVPDETSWVTVEKEIQSLCRGIRSVISLFALPSQLDPSIQGPSSPFGEPEGASWVRPEQTLSVPEQKKGELALQSRFPSPKTLKTRSDLSGGA